MSALLAAGWSRSSRHGVSVVPRIQCSPHGMTNSTLVGVRRISPDRVPPAPSTSAPSIADAGHDQVHALGRPHLEVGRRRAQHLADVVAPDAGGGDDAARADREAGAVGQVGHPDADDRASARRRPAAGRPRGRWRATRAP